MKRWLAILSLCFVSATAMAADDDFMNLRLNLGEFSLFAFGASAEFKIDDSWTLGPQFAYLRETLDAGSDFSSNFDVTAYSIGARANWYKNGAFKTGLYVGPSLQYVSITMTTSSNYNGSNNSISGTATPILLGCLVGYAWFWDHFNMMAGGGGSLGLGSTKVTVKDSLGDQVSENVAIAGLELEFSVGWTL